MRGEKAIEKRLREEVEKQGGICVKLSGNLFLGIPDRICLLPAGRVVFCETKTAGRKPTKIQAYVHDKLRRLGFPVYIVDSYEMIDIALNL